MIGTIIGAIIVGAIIGALARLVLPGKQNISRPRDDRPRHPRLASSAPGSCHAARLPATPSGIDWIALILGAIVAAVCIVVYGTVTGAKQVR